MKEILGFEALAEHPRDTAAVEGAVAAMGNFDGVHRGHQAILNDTVAAARRLKVPSVCITFWPHPATVLRPEIPTLLIQTRAQKREAIAALGVDFLLEQSFTRQFANLEYDVFFESMLRDILKPRALRVGARFAFGHERRGTAEALAELCRKSGIEFSALSEFKWNGAGVSSSRIRALLKNAQLKEAADLLGRDYEVRGRVVHGDARGKALGFPTANLLVENQRLLPRGVYACKVRKVGGTEWWPAVGNWGIRPTIEGQHDEFFEVHLLDNELDLYGEVLDVACIEFLRPEQKFNGIDELRTQIGLDTAKARDILARR